MRIHYTTAIWHGGFSKFFGKALTSLGHNVSFFNESGSRRQAFFKKTLSRVPKLQYAANDKFREAVSRDWFQSLKEYEPDLIILEHAPNVLPKYLEKVKGLKIPIFYWMDSPPAGCQAQDVIASLKFADKVFSIDRNWMTILYQPEDFIHLPLAGDPEVFHPLEPKTEKKYDVVFIGSFPPQSGDGYLRAEIVANLPSNLKVAAFGNGADKWEKHFPILKDRVKSGVALTDSRVNEIYNQSRIVLNIHSTWHSTSISARTYEIALSGAFELVDWREDLDRLFPKDSFITFRFAKDVNNLVSYWLRKPDECSAKVENIRRHILENHTWRNRAEALVKVFTSSAH